MNQILDLTDALEQIKAGAKIEGKDGVLAPLIKQLTEAVLQAELESHLTREINKNRKYLKSKSPDGKDIFIRVKTEEDK